MDFQTAVNSFFEHLVGPIAAVLFWPVPLIKLPLILTVMVSGGLFTTIYLGFTNVRLFKHAIDVVRGKFDNPDDEGEISHFEALTSALSATVGLGNIAGVAVAIQLGGPGAVFWLWIVAFFGMSMKLCSCTLAQLYREVDSNGHVLGGPFVYLKKGIISKYNNKTLGVFLGTFSAVVTILASYGGGNLFQANQTYELIANQFPFWADKPLLMGFILAIMTGIVVLGGIKRIANVTSKMVPAMCLFYVACCAVIIFSNFSEIPALIGSIFKEAFAPDAMYGGFLGVLIQGVKRASFSNEAGVGSAAIAHAAAKTDKPIREGIVAMLGPFIDTIVVCSMTALAILVTKAHLNPELKGMGAQITAEAFATLGSFMPVLLTIATAIFAYSTMISYGYYGERASEFLFGKKGIMPFKISYILVIIMGPSLKLGAVIDFSDLALLSMAFPNIIGLILLSGEIKVLINDYVADLKAGKFIPYK